MVLLLPALARAEPVVLIVGDSISAGFGIPVQQGWVALMQNALEQDVPQLKIVNASISIRVIQAQLEPNVVMVNY